MKRNFVLTDVHGHFQPMMKLFDFVCFDPINDRLNVLGDLIGRGPHSALVTQKIKHLQEQHKTQIKVCIGNHEVMMRRYVFRKEDQSNLMWLRYGGLEVMEDFNLIFESLSLRNSHFVWLANLPLFFADSEYFYTHAGLDVSCEIHQQQENITFTNLDILYSTPEVNLKHLIGQRKMVHGHTPYPAVYDTGRFISCDTGASVLDDDVLTLIDLTNGVTYSYSIKQHHINIGVINQKSKEERLAEYLMWKENL